MDKSKSSKLSNYGKDRFNLYPWRLFWKTLILWFSFFVLGLSDSLRGPTLLDLKDLIDEDVAAVSSTFALRSFGGLIGCFLSGLVLDKLSPSSRFVFLAFATFMLCSTTFYLPFSPNLLIMRIVAAVFGFFSGSFHTAANVLLLNIWKGHNSDPYMYAMHFFFGFGAFLAPIIAKPFLMEKSSTEEIVDSLGREVVHANETNHYDAAGVWTIKTLYPLVGVFMFLAIPGYIYHFIQVLKEERKESKKIKEVVKHSKEEISNVRKYILIVLMAFYYFTFAGLEVSFRTFTSAFGVSCSLNLSRHAAADVLATFYAAYATFRFLSIPFSSFVSPTLVLWSSLSMIGVATVSLSIWAETSILLLKLGVALVGAGVASLFASGMLWIKNVLTVTNRIGAVITMSCSIGSQVYCMVIGTYIESDPMLFMHLMTGTLITLFLCFGLANFTARNSKQEEERIL